MIVKNEEHIVAETLASTLPYATEYLICDTGSTDDTVAVCNSFFRNNNVPGQIFHHEWKNFAYNYSMVLKLGRRHSQAEYLWLIDADDVVVGDMVIGVVTPFGELEKLHHSRYMLKFGTGFVYPRPQIFKNSIAWKHVGVIHGHNTTCDPGLAITTGTIDGDYYIDSRRLGDRHKNIDRNVRYARDAETLEQGCLDEPNNSRYVFYLAQCYYDSEQYEKSIDRYRKRIAMGGWEEEIFWSRLRIAWCYDKLSKPNHQTIKQFWKCFNHHPNRAEPIYGLGICYRRVGNYLAAESCLIQASKIPYPAHLKLFQLKDVYDYKINTELAIVYYHLGKHDKSQALFTKLLSNPSIGPQYMIYIKSCQTSCKQ
jgi:glycosyltransferase involved in cell wall biosynthesis